MCTSSTILGNENGVEPDDASTRLLVSRRFFAFDTIVELTAYADPTLCDAAFDAVRSACLRYEQLFSRTLPHSDIGRLNSACGAKTAIDPETADLLARSLFYCAESAGRFDITIGSLSHLWDCKRKTAPSPGQISSALDHVDWRKLSVECSSSVESRTHLGRSAGRVGAARLADPLAAIDLGGIAKGWIADKARQIMKEQGVSSFILNMGGNIVACGQRPGGGPWRIGIKNPFDPDSCARCIPLFEASAVTSGIYERCFIGDDGILRHHIIDPSTGYPVQTDAVSATAIARKSIDAEGFSTTLLALGIERGIEFARNRPELDNAIFIDRGGGIHEAAQNQGR